jgi:hypothetical protein
MKENLMAGEILEPIELDEQMLDLVSGGVFPEYDPDG